MKISVIQNVYLKNPFIPDSLIRNLIQLTNSGIDFEYIIFNDHGDKEIENDIKMFIDTIELSDEVRHSLDNIKYIYSDTNYGKKMCTGGYVGAIPYISGDVIHHIGQDDLYTSQFYKMASDSFNTNKDIYFFTTNAYRIDEDDKILSIMIDPGFVVDASKPLELFKFWFGVYWPDYEVTRANNGFLAPGTMYKKQLHDLIGVMDLENFRGAADFEYWARILYNGYPGVYIPMPLWFYRISKYSAGNEIIDGKPNRGYWQQLHIQAIKEKYTLLVKQNKDKFK